MLSNLDTDDAQLRVLVVDDCRDNCATLSMLVKLWGYRCGIANGVEKALVVAGTFAPDVVICDIAMPEVTGLELARRMNGDARPIMVAHSGLATEAHRRSATEAGFDLYIIKPVDPSDLRGILQHASELKGTNRRIAAAIDRGERCVGACRELITGIRAELKRGAG